MVSQKPREVVGGQNGPAMTNVPHWAAERMRKTTGPLMVPQTGRRPWAYALSHVNTQSAHMARYYQLGGGVGPVPDASNGFSGPFGPFSTWSCAHSLTLFERSDNKTSGRGLSAPRGIEDYRWTTDMKLGVQTRPRQCDGCRGGD